MLRGFLSHFAIALLFVGLTACDGPNTAGVGIPFAPSAPQAQQLSWLSFKTSSTCYDAKPCFELTPDGKTLILVNPQQQIYSIDTTTGERTKIADGGCSNLDCLAIAPDSGSLAYTKTEQEEMAVYSAALPGSHRFVAGTKPKRLGAFPRYAGFADPNVGRYKISFCGSNQAVFGRTVARLDTIKDLSSAFAFDTTNSSRTDLFYENDGSVVSPLQCDPTTGEVYFTAERATSSAQHQELILKTSLSRLRNRGATTETVFSRDSAPGDQLLSDLHANHTQLIFTMNTPSWDPFTLSGLMQKNLSKSDTPETPLQLFTNSYNRVAGIINTVVQAANKTLFLKTNYLLELDSVSNSDGTSVALTSPDASYIQDSISTNDTGEKLLFAEVVSEMNDTHLVTADVDGSNRKTLWNSGPRDLGRPTPPGALTLNSATLSKNGKCAVGTWATNTLNVPITLALIKTTGDGNDLIPLLSSQNQAARIGAFRITPDSGSVIFIGDPYKIGENHLYLVKTSDCQ